MEPVLAKSAHRFLAVLDRWPPELSLAEHLAADVVAHPLTPQDITDEISAMQIATMTASEPAMRTAYLMVHDELEHGFMPVIAKRLRLPEDDLTVRLCAAAVTGALRVIDEDVSRAIVVDGREVSQAEALSLIDRAIRGCHQRPSRRACVAVAGAAPLRSRQPKIVTFTTTRESTRAAGALPSARHHHSKGSSWPCPKSSVWKTFSARLSAPQRPSRRTERGSPIWRRGRTGSTSGCKASTQMMIARCVTADDNRSIVQLPVDRRSALAAVHPGRQRRRELAPVPGGPGEPGRARRRSHAVPGGQGHGRFTRRTAREGDRPPQQPKGRTIRRVRTRHRHG